MMMALVRLPMVASMSRLSALASSLSLLRGAEPGTIDPEIIFNLGFVYGPVLMVLYFIALAFISRYDISRSGHESHLETLAERQP